MGMVKPQSCGCTAADWAEVLTVGDTYTIDYVCGETVEQLTGKILERKGNVLVFRDPPDFLNPGQYFICVSNICILTRRLVLG